MMTIKDVAKQALLSEASYADLEEVTTQGQLNTAPISEGFSKAQAEDFVTHWKVASQQPDTASGVDAVGDLLGAGSKVMIDDRDALVQMDYRLDAEGAHSPQRAECRV